MSRILCWLLVVLLPSVSLAQKLTREEKVREDRRQVEADGFWIYNDLAESF